MRNLSGPPTPVGPGPDQPPLRTLANLDPSRRAIAEQMIAKYGLDAFQRGGTPEIAASSGSDPYAGDMRTAPRYSETDVGGLNGQVVGVRSPTYQRPSIFDTLANGVTQPPARTPSGYQATVGDPYAGNMLAAPVTRGGALPTGQQLFDTGTGVQTGYGAPRPSGATLDWYDPSTDPYAGEMLPAPVTRPWERADQFFDPTTGVQTGYGGLQPSPEGYTAPTTTPVPSPGMRDVFAGREGAMNLPGAIPSGIGIEMDEPPVPEIMRAGLPTSFDPRPGLGAIWGGIKDVFGNIGQGYTSSAEALAGGLPPKPTTVPAAVPAAVTDDVREATSRAAALADGVDPFAIDAYHGMGRYYNSTTKSFLSADQPGVDPTTMAEMETRARRDPRPSAEGLFDATGMMLPGADVTAAAQPLPTGIQASPNDLSPEEFELAWQQIQYRGTLDPV